MSNKDFYDEDEVINSLVDDKTPDLRGHSRQDEWQRMNGRSNFHVQQVGCGCFDSRKFFANLIIYSVVLMVTAGLFPGFYLNGFVAAIQAAFILTILNTFVKPLIVLFTIPLTIASLGLFYLVINAIIILMTAGMMRENFVITNFLVAFFAAIFIAILQSFIRKKVLKVDQL